MTEAEELLVKIMFVIDKYSLGEKTTDDALEKILYMVDSYKEGVAE